MEKSAPPPYNDGAQMGALYTPMYQPPPQQNMQYQPTPQQSVQYQPAPILQTNVVVNQADSRIGGTCPVCRVGTFSRQFTCCGILCCIVFFPVGILCCLCMMKKRCNHCGLSVS